VKPGPRKRGGKQKGLFKRLTLFQKKKEGHFPAISFKQNSARGLGKTKRACTCQWGESIKKRSPHPRGTNSKKSGVTKKSGCSRVAWVFGIQITGGRWGEPLWGMSNHRGKLMKKKTAKRVKFSKDLASRGFLV